VFALNKQKEIDVRKMRHSMGLTQRVFAQIAGASERNVIRWEAKAVRPNSRSLAVLYRLDELCEILSGIFNSRIKTASWLNTPNSALSGMTPLKTIMSADTSIEGIEEVIDLLNGFMAGSAS
jgi:predicted transcriptional regulator